MDVPSGWVIKYPPANAGDVGFISRSRIYPGEGIATSSSILAWRIPWAVEPDGLESMVLQGVRLDLATKQQTSQSLGSHNRISESEVVKWIIYCLTLK